jgi:hypothetical protein
MQAAEHRGLLRWKPSTAVNHRWCTLSGKTRGWRQTFPFHRWRHASPDPSQPGVCNSPNLFYDIFYARTTPGRGAGWFTNFRVSETPSIQDFSFGGDYIDLTANQTLLFSIWTDWRDKLVFDFEDDVFGSRIIAAGAAP